MRSTSAFLKFLESEDIRWSGAGQDIAVLGDLDLHNTDSILPERLDVQGSLFISGGGTTVLPEQLVVRHKLSLNQASIRALPPHLTVGRAISLAYTSIDALPDGWRVEGDLDLTRIPIVGLPPGLDVTGNLFLWNTKITRLPEDLRVGGRINPPESLDDIHRFMATQATEVTFFPQTFHERMALGETLAAFPDLWRVVCAAGNSPLRILPGPKGTYTIRFR